MTDCFSSKKNKMTKISINAIIQLSLNILNDDILFPIINNTEFEKIMIRSTTCKAVFILLNGKIILISFFIVHDSFTMATSD